MIKIENLTKNYGKNNIFSELSLQIAPNQIVGLLGPNGCGKTTLLKILNGYIMDYSGSVLIDGNKPSPFTKAKVAYLPEEPIFGKSWKVRQLVHYFEDFFSDFDKKKAKEMLELFKLDSAMPVKSMSKGMKEKLHIALVMSRDSAVYLLDEPLGGVDPAARSTILDNIIKNYNQRALLILSTHLISDIEHVLDHVIMLKDRRIIVNENSDVIRARENMSIDAYFRKIYKEA